MIKVVGIDPGLAGTGIGVVEGDERSVIRYSFGCVSTESAESLPFRLDTIYTRIQAFLSDQAPDLVVIEDIYSLERFPGSGIQLGKVSGVILVSAFRAGSKVEEIAVREAKKLSAATAMPINFRWSGRSGIFWTIRNPYGRFMHPMPWDWPLPVIFGTGKNK